MSIDGTETDQQAYPTPITRFWMKLWPNGKMTPQFRPDGSEVLWGEQNSGMIGLKFLPFSTEFAAIVQEKGTFAIPSRLPVVEITLDPSETVNVRRFNARTDGTWYHCQHCNNCFDWPMVRQSPNVRNAVQGTTGIVISMARSIIPYSLNVKNPRLGP